MNRQAEPDANKQAIKQAAKAVLSCKPEDREELCLAVLGRMWGRAPVVSFLDEELGSDAHFWASTATPATLIAYLPAIIDALQDSNVGSIVRQWMIRTAIVGLDEATVRALLAPTEQKQTSEKQRKPLNKAYAAALERRQAFHRSKQSTE